MVNRLLFDRTQLSVSGPGVDVFIAPQFSLFFDGNAPSGKVWTKGVYVTSGWNGKEERITTIDNIWYGKTFPSPPLFCLYLDDNACTGWGDRFQDGIYSDWGNDGMKEWYSSMQLTAYNDHLEFRQYADWYEDIGFNSVINYTIWDHPR